MATVVKTTFQLKRGSAAKWIELNLVLAAGEPGFEIDTGRLKIGDGQTAWLDLPYIGERNVVNAATHYDFPSLGAADVIYKAEEEKLLYQWNSSSMVYEALGAIGGEGTGIVIDTEFSDTSMNPVANKVVKAAIDELTEEIQRLATAGSYSYVVNAETHYDFPSVGAENVIYKASSEKMIYQWNTTEMKYEVLYTASAEIGDIEMIHGGNANGTNN